MSEKKFFHFDVGSPTMTFIFMMGIVNLFGDMTYVGGVSINGQFMALLGASALAVSVTAGAGEFLGYVLRPLSGYIADKTRHYWLVTFIGFFINAFAVPAMVFAEHWKTAALFVFLERIGRAIRKPTVEAMLSYTTALYGRGWVYGLNTAFDLFGGTLGTLFVALVLFWNGSYRTAYALLSITSLLILVSLFVAHKRYPVPANLEKGRTAKRGGFSKSYWLYMIASSFFASGMVSYEIVSYHLINGKIITMNFVPLLIASATGTGMIVSLFLGRMYDRYEFPTILIAVILSTLLSPLIFFGNAIIVIAIGVLFLGVAYATQEGLLKAIIAGVLPKGSRNLAFGLFYLGYGSGWLIGSIVIGWLYNRSLPFLVGYIITVQLLSLPIFFVAVQTKLKQNAQI